MKLLIKALAFLVLGPIVLALLVVVAAAAVVAAPMLLDRAKEMLGMASGPTSGGPEAV